MVLFFQALCIIHLFLLSLQTGECFLKTEFGQYILAQFEKDENMRHAEATSRSGTENLDMNFASSSPFITANGFRHLCYPHIVDYNFSLPVKSQCKLSTTMFEAVPDGACIYVASACFEQVVLRSYLSHVPASYTLVVHDGDQSNPGNILYALRVKPT
jgi:hypothetical protein